MSMRIRISLRAVLLSAMVAGASSAFSATVTWDAGGGNNLWSNPTNWSPNGVPGSTDDVVITNATSFDTVLVDQNETVKSVDIGNGAIVLVDGARTLTLNGPAASTIHAGGELQLQGSNPGGTLTGNGAVTVDGILGIHGNCTLSGSGAVTITSGGEMVSGSTGASAVMTISRNITNNTGGKITFPSTSTVDTSFHGVTITNNGLVDIQNGQDILLGSGSPVLNNNSGGVLRKSVINSVTSINFTVNNPAGATIDVQTGDLALNGGGTALTTGGTITGAGDLHVSGTFSWSGGTISGGGARVLNSTSTPTISCSAANCQLDGAALQLQASTTFSASSNALVFSNGASLTVATSKAFAFINDGNVIDGGGAPSSIIDNGKIWKRITSGTSSIGVPVTLSGTSTVEIDAGTLQFGAGASVTGSGATFEIDPGMTLEVTGGVFDFNSASVFFPFDGDFKVSGGFLRVSALTLTIPNLTLQGGIIDGAGDLHVSGDFNWLGGTILGLGARVLDSSSTPVITCTSVTNCNIDGATLQMNASGTFNATTHSLVFFNGANFIIASGKTLDITTDGTIVGLGGTITNNGTITKSGGTGIRSIGTPLNNTGSVTVTSGGLSLLANGTHSGSFTTTAPGTIAFDGGTHTLSGGISGTGTLAVSGATVTLNSTGNAGGFSMSGGTLGGSGTLTLTNGGTWSGGTMSGSGTTAVAAAKTLTVTGFPTLNGRTLDLGAGAMLDITSQRLEVSSATSMTGSGTVRVNGGTLRVLAAVTQTIPNLTLNAGIVDGAGDLHASGNFTWSGGTLSGSGSRVMNNGSTPVISCSTANCQLDGATLQLQASGTYSASSNALVFSNGASLVLDPGRGLHVNNDGDFVNGGGAASSIVIGGYSAGYASIHKTTTSGMSVVGVPLTISGGAFNLDAGTLRITAGVTVNAGSPIPVIDYDPGCTIEVTGGVFLFNAASSIPLNGDFKVSGGTLRVATGVNITMPNLALESGVVDGGGDLHVSGNFTWSGGTITGSGSRVLNDGSNPVLSCSAANCQLDGSTLRLQEWGTYSASANALVFSNGASLILDPGQVLFVNDDGDFVNGGGAASSIVIGGFGSPGVNGCIEKTTTSGTSVIGVPVTMSGSFKTVTGTLQAAAGVTIAASGAIVHYDPGTTIEVTGGVFLLASGVSFPANGAFKVSGGTLRIPTGVTLTMPNVTLQGSGVIDGGGTLNLSGTSTWAGGTMGSATAPGGVTQVNSGNTLNITNAGSQTLTQGRELLNAGTVNYSGTSTLTMSAGGKVTNNTNFNLTADGNINVSGSATIDNNGTLTKSGGSGTSTLFPVVNSSGTVSATTGTLALAGGGTPYTDVVPTAPATIAFPSGTHSILGTIGGTGTLAITGANVTVDNPFTVGALSVTAGTATLDANGSAGAFNMTGGTLGGSGTLTLTNGGTWSGGTMSGNGTTVNPATKTLSISAPVTLNSRTLQNDGTLSVSGGVTGSGTIDNGGTLNALADLTIGVTLNNSGQVVTSNALSLAGGGTHTGSFNVTTPGSLTFSAGTHSVSGGSIGGSGTLAVSGATVTVGSPFTIGALSVTAGTATLDANGSADAFTMTGGMLGGSGMLTLTNGGTWSGGTMSGSGTTVSPATKTVSISAPVTLNSRTLQNDGTLTVSADITGSGTIANNGTLDTTANLSLGAALNNNGQVVTSNALSLAGNGTHTGSFTVTSPGDLSFSAGTHAMSGGGSITGSGTLTFNGATATVGVPVNVGTLSVSAGTATLDANGSAGAFTMNGGTLGGSGTLTLTNGGTWSGGTWVGGTTPGSGTTVNPATKSFGISAPITLTSRTLQNDGTLSVNGNITGSGTIVNNGSLDTAADVTIGAALNNNGQIATATLLSLGGSGVHSGTFTATAPGVIDFSGGTQTISGALAGTGTLRFSGAAATVTGTWSGMPIEVTGGSAALDTSGTIPALTLSGGTLTGSGDVTVSGPSTWSGGTIAGSGDFTFGTGATVTMPGTNAATLSRPLLNQGTINYTASSNGMVIAGVAVTNDGTVDIQSSQPITATPGTPPFVNHGTLKKSSGSGVMQFGAPLANSSQVRIESGTMEFDGTYTQTAGTTTILSGATLQTETLSVDGGTLTGNGTVVGTVANNAAVAPGASPGTLTIDGDFVQSSDGILKIELAGTTPGTQYDRVLVTGSVNLDGTLSVTTSSGFTPAAGNAFQILTFGSRLYNSTFDVMNGLNGSGFVLVPTFRSDDLRLIATLEANLGVTASAPSSVVLGNAFAYTVGVFNGGAADANSVSVTAALPPNVTFTGATPPICTGAPNLVCNVGHLNHGSTATVVISVTADALGAAPISVATTANEPDSHPANNTAAASTNITAPVADVAVAVTGVGSTIAGTKVIYTVTVSNSGPDTASNIAVTATASPGLTFSANSGACVESFPCSIATLGAGQSATIHSAWDIAPSATGNVQLTVNASAAADVNASNNSDIAVTNIGTCPDVTIVAPEVMTTGLAGEATVTGFGGAAYHWSIVNGTIDKGAGTATIEFTAGEPGTTTLAVNVTGSGCSLNATWEVTVQPRCVGTAMPAAPADGAIAQAVVDFAWSVVDDASGYRLWLQRDGAPAQNLGTALGTTCTRIIPPGTYQWYIETLFDGCASHESERRTVTILPAQDCASREKPQLIAPANELPATSPAVVFSWNAVPQALEYELWLALAGGAPTLIHKTSDTSYTAILPPGRLEWYVRAIFAGCAATESAHRAFTYTPPPQCTGERPLLIAPSEGERLTSPVSFEWTRVSGAMSYELYVDGELAATTTDPHASDLSLPRAERRWKVRARLGEGCGAADSAESRLVVIPPSPSCAPLGTPVLSAPARISSGIAGRIQWTFVSGATAYEVEISGDPEFPRGATSSSIVTARQLPVTFTNQGSAPVARYVRVHAVDTSCVEPKIGPFSPAAELFVLPPAGSVTGREGAAMMTDPTDVQYTLSIAAEHAGQSFTATSTVPWLSVTPSSGVVPPGGQTLRAVANSAGLPAGTNIGTVEITTTDNTATATSGALKPLGITTSTASLSLNNILGVSNAAKSTPPGDALIIPAVANVKNFVVRYESDISVTNTSAEPMTYEINFVPTGSKGISEGKKTKSPVPPGATMFINDIVDTWFDGQSSTGTLEIRPVTETATSTSSAPDGGPADRTTFAASRTFSTTDDVGTYGQYIPAVPYRNFVAKGRTLSLQQIAQSATTRVHTNLGLVEGSGQPVSLEVRIFDAAGNMKASFPRDLNGGEQLQLNSVLKEHGLDDLADGRIEVEVTSDTGKVTAYASVIDDRTRDAQLVPAVTLDHAEHSKWVVPGVTGSGDWQTDVRIFNAGAEAADLTLAFYSTNGGPPATKTIQLKAGEVQQLDRVLSFFGLSGDTGALHVSSTAAAQVVVTARTYQQTASGTFGQFIIAGTSDDAVSAGSPRQLQILQMEDSADFQSIIGFAEVSGEPVTLKVEVLRPRPHPTVGLDVELKPNEFRQIDLASLGLHDVYNARITVSATGGKGQALAYGSLIDRKTGDPTYIPGQ